MFYSSFYTVFRIWFLQEIPAVFFFWGSLAVMDRHMLPSLLLLVNFWCWSGFYRIWSRRSLWKHTTMWKLRQHAAPHLTATRLGPWTRGNGYSSEQEWGLQEFCPVKQCCQVHQRHIHQSTVLGNAHKTRCFRRLSHLPWRRWRQFLRIRHLPSPLISQNDFGDNRVHLDVVLVSWCVQLADVLVLHTMNHSPLQQTLHTVRQLVWISQFHVHFSCKMSGQIRFRTQRQTDRHREREMGEQTERQTKIETDRQKVRKSLITVNRQTMGIPGSVIKCQMISH